MKLWQNGNLLIDENTVATMASDNLYFLQGAKGIYNRIEIGIIQKEQSNSCNLWADNIRFEVVR